MWCDWRGGRVAESTGLLNLHTGNGITSSNLVLSADSGPADICRATLFKNALNRALISGLKLHMTAGNLNDLNLSNLKTGDDD